MTPVSSEPGVAAEIAGIVAARLAAMLRGGVASTRLFEVLAEEPAALEPVSQINNRIQSGELPAAAIAACDAPEWRLLATAWNLAEESGAPLAPALDRMATSLHSLVQIAGRRSVLLAGPRATVRLVAALPPLALMLGWLLGFDPSPVLLSSGGAMLLLLGGLLLGCGIAWARRLTHALETEDRVAGVELELVWIAICGGAPPALALSRVVDSADRWCAEWVQFDEFCSGSVLRSTLDSAASVGAPLGALLLEEAAALRSRKHAELERSAEKLGVRVLIPLGVCVLPSFIVVGVVPVVMSMLNGSGF